MSKRRYYGSSVKPNKVNGLLTVRTGYYQRKLARLVKGIFELDIPIEWDSDYILNSLVTYGNFTVSESPAGILPFKAQPNGYNYSGSPVAVNIAAPIIGDFSTNLPVIGVPRGDKYKLAQDPQTRYNGVLVYLERYISNSFFTFTDMIDIYAEKLASADCSIDVNLMNSRMGYIVEAESRGQAATIKDMIDRIVSGDPVVVSRKESVSPTGGLKPFFNNIKQSYVANDIQDTKKEILYEFLADIGINSANTDKKERLIVDEVNSNNEAIELSISLWKDNLARCVERVNTMFPELNFSIKFREFGQLNTEDMVNDVVGADRGMGDNKPEQ